MEVKRTKTPEQALRALMTVCAKSERAISDVRRSLTRWGVAPEQHQPIIDRLVRERFIDEARYAEAYVREKLNLSRWGVRKIRAALKAKRIPEQTIDEALAQADPQKLAPGFNLVDGEEVFVVKNPAVGLWATAERFGRES